MNSHLLKFFILMQFWVALGCVSIKIPPNHMPSKDYTLVPPAAPFVEIDDDALKTAWQSPTSGNSISVFTNCQNKGSTLDSLLKESLYTLSSPKVEVQKELTYNQRKAIEAIALGTVEGVPVRIKLLVFRKNSCDYSLTYVGLTKTFAHDLNSFHQFVKEFRVQ